MKKATQHTRWHFIDPQTGKKIIRQFRVDATPPSPWVRGTGPHSAEALVKIKENNKKHFKGVPKPVDQKEKMSQAKLGKKFTVEHRQKLTDGWSERRNKKDLRNQEAFRLMLEFSMDFYTNKKA